MVDQNTRASLQSIEARLSAWMVEGELIRNEIRSLLVERLRVPTAEDRLAARKRRLAIAKACANQHGNRRGDG